MRGKTGIVRRLATTRLTLTLGLTLALALGLAVAVTPAASAVSAVEYRRGPAPTRSSINAALGPFRYSTYAVPQSASASFGTATIYYPNDTSQGRFGSIAVVPGYTSEANDIAWLGPRLASNGFIVIIINTNSVFDQPDARGRALLAALDYVAGSSPSFVRSRLDRQRAGVMGHSMGGGGTLSAASARPTLRAAVPLAPWHNDRTWSGVRPATMIIGGSADTVAPVRSYAEPMYESLRSADERAYAEIAGANHSTGFLYSDHPMIGSLAVSWMKRFIDGDTRYNQFLCPAPTDSRLTEYRDSCPHD